MVPRCKYQQCQNAWIHSAADVIDENERRQILQRTHTALGDKGIYIFNGDSSRFKMGGGHESRAKGQ